MFIRRVNDKDFDLEKNYVNSLHYRHADTFETFQVLNHSGSNQFVLRGYVSGNKFFSLYYGITPGSCMAAMQIIIDNWEQDSNVLDFTDITIKKKLERADFEWLSQYPTYYDLPQDIRSHMTREFYDEMQNKIKMMSQ